MEFADSANESGGWTPWEHLFEDGCRPCRLSLQCAAGRRGRKDLQW